MTFPPWLNIHKEVVVWFGSVGQKDHLGTQMLPLSSLPSLVYWFRPWLITPWSQAAVPAMHQHSRRQKGRRGMLATYVPLHQENTKFTHYPLPSRRLLRSHGLEMGHTRPSAPTTSNLMAPGRLHNEEYDFHFCLRPTLIRTNPNFYPLP